MAIPSYRDIMLPLLKISSQKDQYTISDAEEELSKFFNLSDTEKKKLLPSGTSRVFYDRVRWAIKYLRHADLLVSTGRGSFKITPSGLELLNENPKKIDEKHLQRFPGFLQYRIQSSD